MSITTSRRLAEATSCWLHHEYLCQRAGLFDEAVLKGVVGQVLSTFILDVPARAWSNVVHPCLETYAVSGGKPKIDFALAELNGSQMGKLRIAVETKWADSSHCSAANIVYDIFRLALLSKMIRDQFKYECECIFVLAGSKSKLKALLSEAPFKGKPKLPLKQGTTQWIKGKHYDQLELGAWFEHFEKAANMSAFKLVLDQGFVDTLISFSPGIPAIDLKKSITDHSVKFGALAWSVRGY